MTIVLPGNDFRPCDFPGCHPQHRIKKTARRGKRAAQGLAHRPQAALLPLARRPARQGRPRAAAPRGITSLKRLTALLGTALPKYPVIGSCGFLRECIACVRNRLVHSACISGRRGFSELLSGTRLTWDGGAGGLRDDEAWLSSRRGGELAGADPGCLHEQFLRRAKLQGHG